LNKYGEQLTDFIEIRLRSKWHFSPGLEGSMGLKLNQKGIFHAMPANEEFKKIKTILDPFVK